MTQTHKRNPIPNPNPNNIYTRICVYAQLTNPLEHPPNKPGDLQIPQREPGQHHSEDRPIPSSFS